MRSNSSIQRRQKAIWTIGHSNRPLEQFVELLQRASVEQIADVRRFPASKAHPHFNREQLEASLAERHIGYRWFVELGGRRTKRASASVNTAWRVEAFNAFADYMQTEEFQASLSELMSFAESRPTAIMCAEALPWRCHRRIIADALMAQGWSVFDIVGPNQTKPHSMPEFARVADGEVTYPGESLF
jgi:uncharacterized protein (DUF488 family)